MGLELQIDSSHKWCCKQEHNYFCRACRRSAKVMHPHPALNSFLFYSLGSHAVFVLALFTVNVLKTFKLKRQSPDSQIHTQSSIFIPVPLYPRSCLHFSDTYREAKHTTSHRACLQIKKSSHKGLTTQRKISEGTKTLLFSVWPDLAKTNLII